MSNAVAYFDSKASSSLETIGGVVEFHQCSINHATKVMIRLNGFKPDTVHGIHVHKCGDLTQGCASACAHYNPDNQLHGSDLLYGTSRHVGDLCNNITADSNGMVIFTYEDDLVDLIGSYSIIGRMVVIHKNADDLGRFRYEDSKQGKESGVTGNAGKRIACAVIGITDRDLCEH